MSAYIAAEEVANVGLEFLDSYIRAKFLSESALSIVDRVRHADEAKIYRQVARTIFQLPILGNDVGVLLKTARRIREQARTEEILDILGIDSL